MVENFVTLEFVYNENPVVICRVKSSEKYVNNLRLFSSIFQRLSLSLFPYLNVYSLFWLNYRATNSKSHNHINALSCRDISDLIAHFPPVSIIDILFHCSLFRIWHTIFSIVLFIKSGMQFDCSWKFIFTFWNTFRSPFI